MISIAIYEFDGWASGDEADGQWEYELDDWGITYGRGPWPFYQHYQDEKRRRVTSVRLSPNKAYQSWRTGYALAYVHDDGSLFCFTFDLWDKKQGMGGYVWHVHLSIENGQPVGIENLPPEIVDRVRDRWGKFERFLAACIAERDARKRRPITAHERYEQREHQRKLASATT